MRRQKQKNPIVFGHLESGEQLSFPLDMLRERHFMVTGRTGQRKTLFTLSQLKQFHAAGDGVIFIDLGGDKAAYQILKRALRPGKRLWLCSIDKRHDSFYFDPLITGSGFSDQLIASNAVGSGLNLIYSEGYGRSFWGRYNVADINDALDRLASRGIISATFKQLTEELKQIAKARGAQKQTSEAVLAADQLHRVHYFGEAPTPDKQLNLRQAIRNGDIVYFWCPTALYGWAARAIATLASWCVMVEMAQLDDDRNDGEHSAPPVTHLTIDEYAQVASGKSSLESQLVLSRKWGLQMTMVFQDYEQMRTPDGDLFPTLRSNCQRFIFDAISEDAQKDLMNASTDEIKYLPGRSISGTSTSNQERAYIAPALERSKVQAISGKAMWVFGIFNLGDKHRDPIPFEIIPPTNSVAEHNELKHLQMPLASSTAPVSKDASLTPELIKRHEALNAVIAAKRKTEWCEVGRNEI